MTFIYPDQPLDREAALLRLDETPPTPDGEVVRHIIIG